jgi:hypothetical protein
MHRLVFGTSFHGFMATLFGVGLLTGCSSPPNPIASNISYGPDDQFSTRILDASERQQVIEIMQAAVTGPTNDPARPAPYGVRWEDVTNAAIRACSKLDLAVLSVNVEEDGKLKRIKIVSVGSVPYELVVRQLPPPRIYEATATAGVFEDEKKAAELLLEAFDKSMRAFGSKPGWTELSND